MEEEDYLYAGRHDGQPRLNDTDQRPIKYVADTN